MNPVEIPFVGGPRDGETTTLVVALFALPGGWYQAASKDPRYKGFIDSNHPERIHYIWHPANEERRC